jgi:hypothetical protein
MFGDSILWNSCSHFFSPPPVRLLYLAGYHDRKEKNLNEISPPCFRLRKSLEMWGFMGIGPISTPPCLYVGPYSPVQPMAFGFTPTRFLIESSDQWVFAVIDPFLSHSWSRHIVGGSNLCFRLESFFFKYVFSMVSCL